MKTVTLISKNECHLCDEARNVLLQAQKKVAFDLKEKKIVQESREFEEYYERIPVILIDGVFAFQYRVSELQLLKFLNKKDS
ncbi:MAG: glutaredoxin family protein [Bacteroidota bacterium]